MEYFGMEYYGLICKGIVRLISKTIASSVFKCLSGRVSEKNPLEFTEEIYGGIS